MWCEVNQRVNSVFRESFFALEENRLLNPLEEMDMFSLHYVYLRVINEALREFVLQYNHHPLRTANNQSPLQLWHSGTLGRFGNDAIGVNSILAEDTVASQSSNANLNGNEPASNVVHVPQNQLDISDEQIAYINGAISHISQEDHTGRYLAIRGALHGFADVQ